MNTQPPMPHRTRNAGFTLTELMISLAVLGVMVAIAIPSVLAWMPSIYLKDAAYDLKGAVIRARSLAINEGIEHRVLFDLANDTYQVDRGNLTSGSTVWTTIMGPHPVGSGITYAASAAGIELDGTNPVLRFSVRGSVVTNIDTLFVTVVNDRADTYRVDVQRRTGHPSLVKGG